MRRAVACALCLLVVTSTGGCGFNIYDEPTDHGYFDPYHAPMETINAEYTHNLFVTVPTMIGNALGVAGFIPLTMLTLPFGDVEGTEFALFDYAAGGTAYFGGFITGTPFVLLNLIFVRWWHDGDEGPHEKYPNWRIGESF